MISIKTKYLSPTASRGSRIKVTANGHQVTIPYSYGRNEDMHAEAALKLARKMNWKGTLVSGEDNNGFTFNFLESKKYEV